LTVVATFGVATAVLLANLIADIGYAVADPRVAYDRAR
jgi:ABC-type dipeptide/oligopeptide/nickel transport system permease component